MEENKKITFEDIKKANEEIGTTNIKGKEYAEVNQRIKAFRMVYPTGMIKTEMISNVDGVCVFRAYVYSEPYKTTNVTTDGDIKVDTLQQGHLLATGTAYEKENSTFINKTSYIENCETSALGRALGIAGFGIDTSVASAEEVQNAINNQNDDKLELMNKMNKLEVETETNHEDMLQYYGVESNNQMSVAQLKDCIKKLEKKASK